MPLLGKAAMLLCFDIVEDAIAAHDDWHTHEHLPERLSISGFLRGTRWVALQAQPRYLVLYEVRQLDVLTSAAYLDRLNHPTPWTSRTMPHYRGMTRGLCSVQASHGFGMGHVALLIRFSLGGRLQEDFLRSLPARPGVGSVHLLKGAVAAPMTNEQRIRGADAGVDWALLVTGYGQSEVSALAQGELSVAELEKHGATGVVAGLYRSDYTLTAQEIAA
jgi:hypothetical protein